jgi:hypothetical protein
LHPFGNLVNTSPKKHQYLSNLWLDCKSTSCKGITKITLEKLLIVIQFHVNTPYIVEISADLYLLGIKEKIMIQRYIGCE